MPLQRALRFSLVLSTLVAATAVSQAAFEQVASAETPQKKKVAVGAFDGQKSDEVRSAFIEALKKSGDYEVTDAEDIKSSAKGPAIAEAAKGLGVNFVITGKVQKGFLLKLKVNRGGGSVIDTVEIKGGGSLVKLKAAIDSSGADTVGGPIGVTKAAAAEDKKPDDAPAGAEEEKKDDEEKPADASPSSSSDSDEHHGLSPLEVTAGLRPYHRTFEFHDTVASLRPGMGFTDLLRYELPLGPALFIDLNFFPGSLVAKGPAEWVGITAGFEKGFATQSLYAENTPNEKTLKTDMQSWYAGLRFRLPLGEHQLGLAATYGQHQFNLKGDEVSPTCSVCPLVPDVKYGYVKIGLDGEFHFGDFIAGARIGKRIVMSTGELKSVWFPNVKAQSLEAGLTAGYRLVSVLDLLVGFDWLRYAFNFNPVPLRMPAQANYVAGGAVDEYFSGNIAFRFHMPASGGAQ